MKKDINVRISNILKLGVFSSVFFIFLGIILLLLKDQSTKLEFLNYSIKEMILGLTSLDYYAYLMCGILILILTPMLRILGLLWIYYQEKDYKFVWISIIVLIILVISLLLGVTHN